MTSRTRLQCIASTPRSVAAWGVLLVLLVACRHTAPLNEPIRDDALDRIHERMELASEVKSGEVLVAVTFSGGGTRAAAFAYGVLRGLAETTIEIGGQERRLIDEIDLISSVSGGSFTAAYFGLHGDGIFDDYEDVFLRRNVQRGLVLEMLRPRYWLGFMGIDRSQLAARYYDRKIFRKATFADMARPESPAIVLNATDLTTAGRFSFTPLFFSQLCSDLESYPVSSAVTASSAVPVVFPTVRLANQRGECDPPMPSWLATELDDAPDDFRALVRGQLHEYIESLDGREYIHLLDGGISDNLGLLNGVAAIAALGEPEEAMRGIGHENVRLILLVTVDAGSETERPWDQLDKPASPIQVVNGLSGAEIERNNELVTKLARLTFADLAEDLSTPDRPVEFIHSEISFEKVENEEERSALSRIQTSFNLSDAKVDLLISAGQRLTHESPGIRRATDDLETGVGDR